MLEHLPKVVGEALRGSGPGLDALVINRPEAAAAGGFTLESPAFADGEPIPLRHTADGQGASPPLAWSGTPPQTACVALIVEDADSPTPEPLVHAIAPVLPPAGELPEGALSGTEASVAMGRNSYLQRAYLPADPPPGHGPHRYAFELFALREAPADPATLGRSTLVDWLNGRVLAKACLIGIYERR